MAGFHFGPHDLPPVLPTFFSVRAQIPTDEASVLKKEKRAALQAPVRI